jgi:hypothetical protein
MGITGSKIWKLGSFLQMLGFLIGVEWDDILGDFVK